ncbi:hypothetical protein DAI22_04g023500 [Oryza sativa Japonica Group]|nr:hypothetical protein DAI22_04g023500 [Oryza sativa Japonica Group]
MGFHFDVPAKQAHQKPNPRWRACRDPAPRPSPPRGAPLPPPPPPLLAAMATLPPPPSSSSISAPRLTPPMAPHAASRMLLSLARDGAGRRWLRIRGGDSRPISVHRWTCNC